MPVKKQVTKEELLEDLKKIDQKLDKIMSCQDYKENGGKYQVYFFKNRFGSWNNAKKQAGLETYEYNRNISNEELLDDIKRVAEEENTEKLSMYTYQEKGKMHSSSAQERFGSWTKACLKAGIKPERTLLSKEQVHNLLTELDSKTTGRITKTDIEKHSELSIGIIGYHGGLKNLRKELDITSLEDDFQKILEYIENQNISGKYKARDFEKEIKEKTGLDIGFKNHNIKKFCEYADQNSELEFSLVGSNPRKILVKDGTYKNESCYRESMKNKYDSLLEGTDYEDFDKFEEFIRFLSKGFSPRGTLASLIYVFKDDSTQASISEQIGVSEVTIRNRYKEIAEELDVEVEAYRE